MARLDGPHPVLSAFDELLEGIEAEIERVNQTGARVLQARDYMAAQTAIGTAEAITALRARLDALRREWVALVPPADPEQDPPAAGRDDGAQGSSAAPASRRHLGRIARGVRTPEEEFRIPILAVLDEMGGSARVADVLERVYRRMSTRLNEWDHQPLPSNPNSTRWYNTAQWARNIMAREGLLRSDSPHGVWQINDRGRAALREHSAARRAASS